LPIGFERLNQVEPLIFLANGSRFGFIDRGRFPVRQLSQFYTPDDLERLAFQRQYGQPLHDLGRSLTSSAAISIQAVSVSLKQSRGDIAAASRHGKPGTGKNAHQPLL